MTLLERPELEASYQTVMNDMRRELSKPASLWSMLIHSRFAAIPGVIFGGIITRPRSLLYGAILATITLFSIYLATWLYDAPFINTEPLIAFIFGWIIGLLYDIFFVLSRRHTR